MKARLKGQELGVTGLRRLYRQMSRGVVFQDRNGAIVSANPAALRILGISQDQITGRTSMDPRWRAIARSGEPLEGRSHPAMKALLTGEPVNDEIMGVFRPERGDYVWVSVSAFPQKRGDRVTGVFTTFEDVSGKLWAEDALRASELSYRNLFEHMILGVAVHELLVEEDGRAVDYIFLEANESFGQLTGLDPREIIGKRVTEIINNIEPRYISTYGEVVRTGVPVVFEDEVAALGRRFLVSAFKTGERQFATIFDDITERSRAAAELRRAAEERKALFSELEHRVKNSLALIAGLVALEEERTADPAARAALESTRDRISSLSALYEQLHGGGDSLDLSAERYVRRVVEGIVAAYATDEKGISIETRAEDISLPSSAATSLGIIVNELVTNALKHGFPGGRGGRVTVSLRRLDEGAELEVSDDGVGLPDGFDFAASSSLGTRLVKMLAAQLGGDAEAKGRGTGTAFIVRFPLMRPSAFPGSGPVAKID